MTITWGECGHPLRRKHPPSSGMYCRVCWLEARAGEPFDLAAQTGLWRGREDEANAWECSWMTLEDRARVEQADRDHARNHWERDGETWLDSFDWSEIGHTSRNVPFVRPRYDPVTGRRRLRWFGYPERLHRGPSLGAQNAGLPGSGRTTTALRLGGA